PDLTSPQLRQALKARGIDHKALKRKAELVQRLQDAIAADKSAQREKRIQSGDFKNEKATPSLEKKSAKSVKHTDGFHRIPADCVVTITQYLEFKDVAAVAHCGQMLNGLASQKLKGQPSPALWRRQVLNSVPKLSDRKVTRLLSSMPQLQRIDCALSGSFLASYSFPHLK